MHNASFWLIATASTLASAVGCEFWAAFVHRVLWHGPLWSIHKSHHAGPKDLAPRTGGAALWEINDVFGIAHALLATGLIVWGLQPGLSLLRALAVGIGCGLSLYGLAYAVVHDGIIHGRWRRTRPRSAYFRRIFGAHQAHHRTGGAPYGLFLAPLMRRRRPLFLRRCIDAPGTAKASALQIKK